MNSLQILSFVGFTLLVAIITWWKVRKTDTGSQQGYFLAGRSLKAPVIAASLMLTNLSTEQLVGLSGQAYKSGMSVMGWEVTSAVTLIFLVSATETIGDTSALTMVGLNREVKEKELSGSIACDGFVSSLSACFGCLPITSFSQNVGLVAMTKVVNRKAIATGAVIMILAAFLPVISVIFASLPEAVLGGCTIMMFGNIIVSGFQMIARAGFSQRNILIAALSLAVGIGFTQVSALFANFPELIQSVFAQNCVAVVFLVAVVANLVLPKDAGIEGATAMSERSTAEAAPSVDEDGDLATA